MMAVSKERTGWRADVYLHGKKVRTKCGFQRKRDAQVWHDDFISGFRKKPDVVESVKQHTFEDLLQRFEKLHLPTVRVGTRDRYLVDIKGRIKPHFQFMKLEDIDSANIEGFKIGMLGKITPKSVNNCLHLLRLMLNKAVKWKMLKTSPYESDSLKVSRCWDDVWWDDKEYIVRFLEEARKRSRYFSTFVIALETGMRLGEVVGLSKRDIDLERGRIHVWRQWLDRYKRYGPCKHDVERWIDFDPNGHLAEVLRRAIRVSPHPEAIVVTAKGERPASRGLADRYFKNIIRRAGVPMISFHGLRHTFASWYMIEKDDIWTLKNILGHSDVRTTQKYAHHSARHKRDPLNLTEFLTRKSPAKLLRVVGNS